MQERDLARILESLKWMAEAEESVGEFYRACAEVPGEEATHRNSLLRMEEMVSQKPEYFSLHRPFNPAATRTFLSFIRQNTADLKGKKIPREKILFIARDIERSLLELAFFEVIKTAEPDWERTLKEIKAQTVEHKNRLEKRIAQTQSPR